MIYLDNAATTRTAEEVVEAMLPYFAEQDGNPSAVYSHGSLRLTLSEENTQEELDFVVEQLKQIVQKLRDMSQLYEAFTRKNGDK